MIENLLAGEPELLAAYRAGRLRLTVDGLLEVVYPLRHSRGEIEKPQVVYPSRETTSDK